MGNDPIEVVELGHFLSVVVHPSRGQPFELEAKRRDAPPLYWCPTGLCLLFSEHRPRKTKANDASRSQIRVYQRWHDSDPTGANLLTYPHDLRGPWQKLGEVRRIDYHSTKWGDDVEYKHTSRGGSYLYRLGSGASSVYAIRGKMRATERGLVK